MSYIGLGEIEGKRISSPFSAIPREAEEERPAA
jgi:hypothetical protein